MRLPESRGPRLTSRREILTSRGLNYTDQIQDGDLASCDRLSFRRWPSMSVNDHDFGWVAFPGALNGAVTYKDQVVLVAGGDVLMDLQRTSAGSVAGKRYRGFLDMPQEKHFFTTLNGTMAGTYSNVIQLDTGEVSSRGMSSTWDDGVLLDNAGKTLRFPEGTMTHEMVSWMKKGDALTVSAQEIAAQSNILAAIEIDAELEVGSLTFENAFLPQSAGGGDEPVTETETTTGAGASPAGGEGGGEETTTEEETVSGGQTPAGGAQITDSTELHGLRIQRIWPELDFLCEHDNRIWGVSNSDSTIYASALGDLFNFYRYQGLSTDSYAVATQAGGQFTGCCSIGDGVLFFTATGAYKIVGSYPAEYVLYRYDVPGVKAGCERSIVVENTTVYYVGIHGVYAYSGGTARLISERLGRIDWEDASAAVFEGNLYISAHDNDRQEDAVYSCDLSRGIWIKRSSGERYDYLFTLSDQVLGVREAFVDLTAMTIVDKIDSHEVPLSHGGKISPDVMADGPAWHAEFTPFYDETHGKKRPARITIRVEMEAGAWVRALVSQDQGRWKEAGLLKGEKEGAAELRIAAGRCDAYRIRLEGSGQCVVKGIFRDSIAGGIR